MVFDDQARVRWLNQTACDLMGYRLEDIVGTSVFDFVHPDDLGYMLSSWEKRLDHPDEPGPHRPGSCPQQRRLVAGLRDHRPQPARRRRGRRHGGHRPGPQPAVRPRRQPGPAAVDGRSHHRHRAPARCPGSVLVRQPPAHGPLGPRLRPHHRLALDRHRPPRRHRGRHGVVRPADRRRRRRHQPRAGAPVGPGRAGPCTSSCTAPTRSPTPSIDGVIVSARDVEEIVAMQRMLEERNERLSHAVTHDQLTGLYSRRAFVDAVGDVIALRRDPDAGARPGRRRRAVLRPRRLQGGQRQPRPRGGRPGAPGDRGAGSSARSATATSSPATAGTSSPCCSATTSRRPRCRPSSPGSTARVTTPVTIDGVTARVGVSIGVSREPADTAEVDSLLSAADAAMYNRKRVEPRTR